MTEVAEKKSSPLKWILLGCGGCGLVGILFFVGVFGLAMMATGPATDAARLHVDTVKQGKVDEAYDAASSGFKESLTKEEFREFTQTWGALYAPDADLTLTSRNINNNMGTMVGSSTGSSGTVQVTIKLLHDGTVWRVSSVKLSGDRTVPKDGR